MRTLRAPVLLFVFALASAALSQRLRLEPQIDKPFAVAGGKVTVRARAFRSGKPEARSFPATVVRRVRAR